MRRTILIATLAILATAASAHAADPGKSCTTEPKEKWMSIEAIEKIVKDHGYEVLKSKIENTCFEIYARDKQGVSVEYYIDPTTGNPVGAEWEKPAK